MRIDLVLFDLDHVLSHYDRPSRLQARAAAMQADRAVLSLLPQLQRQVRRAILTNNGPLVTEHLARLCPPLVLLFAPEQVLGSGHFGLRKPDPAIYTHCLTPLRAQPQTTLFIDDRAENVEGARAAGLHAFHFTAAAALRDALFEYRLLASVGGVQPAR